MCRSCGIRVRDVMDILPFVSQAAIRRATSAARTCRVWAPAWRFVPRRDGPRSKPPASSPALARVFSQCRSDSAARRVPTSWPLPGPTACFKPSSRSTRDELHRIAETQRQLSSCPVLFAWDGRRFQFVTDVLGVGGIGFFESPGVYSAPFPRENVLLPEGSVVASDGVYRLKLAEPMEEVTYLDQASLVAYDLPPGWRMALDERKAIGGPAPTGAPIFYREERLASRALNDRGEDVTTTIAVADRSAEAGPAHVDPRFIGLARPHAVTLTFDRPIDRGAGRPVLLVDGWIDNPYAQTVFAAWQAGAVYRPADAGGA